MDAPEAEVAAAIRQRLAELDRSLSWLGAEVARVMGRADPFSQATVSKWLTVPWASERSTAGMSPAQVFAAEQALGMRPGTLSRSLGYLPTSSRSARTVPEAIDADPKLTALGRRVLAATYEELVSAGD